MRAVLAEDPGQRVSERALTRALLAPKHQRRLRTIGRVLEGPRDPVDDVGRRCSVARGKHLLDVPSHERPVAGLGLDAPPFPQVQAPVDFLALARLKGNALVLPA